jgi:hypothetical protein
MDVTTVIVNYQTPDLLTEAVTSFHHLYPQIPVLIIDNGSEDDSKEAIERIRMLAPESISVVLLESNIYHGPAMDLAIQKYVKSKYTFFLDSDTETRKGGFLEEMTGFLDQDESIYGIGSVIKVNKRGFKDPNGEAVLLTPYMMIRTQVYKELPPFIHHGQPTIHNFREARVRGWKLQNYNIEDYIFHHWRGTANRFGYGLGIKGKIDYLLNKLGI